MTQSCTFHNPACGREEICAEDMVFNRGGLLGLHVSPEQTEPGLSAKAQGPRPKVQGPVLGYKPWSLGTILRIRETPQSQVISSQTLFP